MNQLTDQLRRWQHRELGFRLAWAFARWFAIVLAALTLACLADWLIDRRVDTPFALRVLMTIGQIVVALGLGYFLFSRLRVPHIDELAGKAEEELAEFDHRLVTSLQLNRPGAKTQGMSSQLLEACTLEAECLSARHNLAGLADSKRIERAAIVFFPSLLFAGIMLAVWPTVTMALMKRQCLLDESIPRTVSIENITPSLLPAGDAVKLKFQVRGEFREDGIGQVTVEPDGMPSENYVLKYDSNIDGETALFVAEMPAASTPFNFKARLHDGRTRTVNRVDFAARPVVTEISAWLILPDYVDPAGKLRYERFQPQGEVTTLPDSGLHIECATSKPVTGATLILYSRPDGKNETETSRLAMTLYGERRHATVSAPMISGDVVAYRIEVIDENRFRNANPPRRGIASGNYKTPSVKLLPEVLKDPKEPGPLEDFAVDGMPLVLEGQVQIGYHARSPLGISNVFIWYRVNPQDREKDAWTPLPMTPVLPDLKKTGRFVPELGVFENSGPFGVVECYLVPAMDPSEPSGIEAGGRYNFQTKFLTKKLPNGGETKLEVGDQVEFLVAAYDRQPDPHRLPGESQSRLKAVVTQAQLDDWRSQNLQSRGRLEELFAKQRRVFQGNRDSQPGKP